MTKLTKDITNGILHSAYLMDSFDKGKKALEKEGYRIISAQELARLRIQEGASAEISEGGNWTKECFIYVPKKGIFLTPNSPIIENPAKATYLHLNHNLFWLTNEQVEKSLADSVKVPAEGIQTDKFNEEEITSYLFGKNAKEYGEFLNENKVSQIPFDLAPLAKTNKPYASQLWIHRINGSARSRLNGDYFLHCSSRMRGVRDGKAAAYKEKESKLARKTYDSGRSEDDLTGGIFT